MKIGRPFKLALIAAAIAPLVAFASAHSLATVKAVNEPHEALDIYPGHGIAQSYFAFERFYKNVELPAATPMPSSEEPQAKAPDMANALAAAARTSFDEARLAYQLEPLSPRAHAVLALTQGDLATRYQIVDIASQLNKREFSLQGLALEKNISEGSYQKVIETIDQVLRVYPDVYDSFFPILLEVLAIEDTLPELAELFAKPLPWRQSFMNYALGNERVLRNLGLLRGDVELGGQDFDQRLIGRLFDSGERDLARSVYHIVRPGLRGDRTAGKLDWVADYPPFEWRLAALRGLRAQIAEDGGGIEVHVSPGEGGVIAARVIPSQGQRFTIRISHDLNLSEEIGSLKLELVCVPSGRPVFESAVKNATETFAVDAALFEPCEAYQLILSARSWTGAQALNGKISSVSWAAR